MKFRQFLLSLLYMFLQVAAPTLPILGQWTHIFMKRAGVEFDENEYSRAP
jgi:hypothetical protein